MLDNLSDRAKGALLLAAISALLLVLLAILLYPRLAPSSADAAEKPTQAASPAPARARADTAPTPAPGPATAPDTGPDTGGLPAPASTEMTLTVPALDRVQDVRVKTAHGAEDGPLRYGAMHVLGTGYPWEPNANTYIAGHRLGFPGTPSDRLFWDLDDLKTGDEVLLTDAEDRHYEYRVFRESVVGPDDISVAKPIAGKDVVSLQTCTLPNYTKRLVVQAELVGGPSPKKPPKGARPNSNAFGVAG